MGTLDPLQSLVVKLDATDQVLIFADSHLTTYDPVWMRRCGAFLEEFTGKIIIAGDFWDGYHVSQERFHAEWSELLQLLHHKDCIYIPGNHDKPEWNTYWRRFARAMVASVLLEFPSYRVHCEHGDLLAPDIDWYAPTLAWYLASIPYRWFSFHKPAIFGKIALANAYRVYEERCRRQHQTISTLCIGHIHVHALARNGKHVEYLSPGLFRGSHPHAALLSNTVQSILTL